MKPRLVHADLRLHDREGLRGRLGLERLDPTDEDLVLAAYEKWGDDCAARIVGDFAFAVHDPERDRVAAFRDPIGNRPLAYRAVGDRIAFAPTARGLATVPPGVPPIDERRVADALIPPLEGADATSTFFREISRLPPGCRLEFRGGVGRVTAYWNPDPAHELHVARDEDAVEGFCSVFREAVRCRLDDGTASMLSGGLDSSAIVAFARRIRADDAGPPLVTLSAVLEDRACDETACARAVIAQGGLEAVTFDPSAVESLGEELDRFLDRLEEPFDAEMVIPFLAYASARRRGLVAVLDGVDGDSVASHEPDILGLLLREGSWIAATREARGLARFYEGSYAPWASAARLLAAQGLREALPDAIRSGARAVLRGRRTRRALAGSLIRPEFAASAAVAERLEGLRERGSQGEATPRGRQLAGIRHPNLAAALERYHRVAAAAGVEARHPFMDARLVEFCLALPRELKLRDGWSKYVVRRAVEPWLPPSVAWRRGRWHRLGPEFLSATIRSRRRRIDRVVEDPPPALEPYVDPVATRAAHERFRRTGDPASGEALWRVAHLAFCLRTIGETRYDVGTAWRADAVSARPSALR